MSKRLPARDLPSAEILVTDMSIRFYAPRSTPDSELERLVSSDDMDRFFEAIDEFAQAKIKDFPALVKLTLRNRWG